MPLAKIYVAEGRYDEDGLAKVSEAVQAALIATLKIPPDDFFQLIFELPAGRYRHTPSFVGMHYSENLITLELTFISDRPKDVRLALLKDLNRKIVEGAGVSPDDLIINLHEIPGENASFGQGEAQRAFVSGGT
jgi:hypothetical protein